MGETITIGRAFLPILLVLIAVALIAQMGAGFSQGANNRNVSVDTTVNITGSAPYVVRVYQQSPVTLNAGSLTILTCNATVRDYNGFADINSVNATFFHSSSSENAADDNNTHYTNASCVVISGQQDGFFSNYTCSFPVVYYALNGTWNCTVRANDSINLTAMTTNTTTINALYALNVTVLIDYGNVTAGDYSENQTADVVNLGNVPMNISVLGYGQTINDNLSFVCDQGNLSVDTQRFSADPDADYAAKIPLNRTFKAIPGVTVNKTSNGSFSTNTTYWQLYVDPTQQAFGRCNGTIVFQAQAA
ncbi:TPA: hypothetical protein HA251_00525 [Candidatus Woesearchaeota archaeon]|nr:hypothetical protein [Candidatus Woesearchaeota archaeon]